MIFTFPVLSPGQVRGVPAGQRSDVRVRDVACRLEDLPVAGPDEALVELLPRLNACGHGRALVLDGERLVGIVTPADVARAVELAGLDRPALDLRREPPAPPVRSFP